VLREQALERAVGSGARRPNAAWRSGARRLGGGVPPGETARAPATRRSATEIGDVAAPILAASTLSTSAEVKVLDAPTLTITGSGPSSAKTCGAIVCTNPRPARPSSATKASRSSR